MLRWGPARVMDTLCLADLELDLVRHRATRAGARLDLTPKEFLLLSLLMRKAGEVLSRTVIAEQVWEINFDSNTNFVDVHIRRLRAKVKVDDPYATKLSPHGPWFGLCPGGERGQAEGGGTRTPSKTGYEAAGPPPPARGKETTRALPTISISESPGIHSTAMQARDGALPGLK